MVEVRGDTSNRNEAATAARAFARPRRDGEPSELVVSKKMVGAAGIEPATPTMST